MLKVTLRSVSITDFGFVIILTSRLRKKVLPIFVGPVEAQLISAFLMGMKPKRPLTHDLMITVIDAIGFKIDKIEINKIHDGTYFANIHLTKNRFIKKVGKKIVIDSRPSDAISLALQSNVPIYVPMNLFDENSIEIDDDINEEIDNSEKFQTPQIKKKKGARRINDEIGVHKQMLEQAIKEERFEDASKIRDKIKVMIQKIEMMTKNNN